MKWLKRGYGIARSIAMYHGQPTRRRTLPQIYAHFLGAGDLAFDVGSHAGNRITAFRKLGARVVAIEPQPDFVSLLERWYGSDPQVTLLPIGLAEEPGTLPLHISTTTPTLSTFATAWMEEVVNDHMFAGTKWDERIDVEVRTLAQLIEEFGEPDFCKIDVEGFEAEVVRGSDRPLKALSFEYIPASLTNTHAVIDQLELWGGYQYRTSVGESHAFTQEDWISAAEVRDYLEGLVDQGVSKSGDVYARRA